MPNNLIRGSMPAALTDLTRLRDLTLNKNLLTGTIPGNLAQKLTLLTSMQLGDNSLEGTIASELGTLSLLDLRVEFNKFIGEFPSEVGAISSLGQLTLTNSSKCTCF